MTSVVIIKTIIGIGLAFLFWYLVFYRLDKSSQKHKLEMIQNRLEELEKCKNKEANEINTSQSDSKE